MQFLVYVADMGGHRGQADVKRLRDFFVEVAVRQQIQNLQFPRRQFNQFGNGRTRELFERLHHFPGNGAGHRRSAPMHLLQGGD